MKKQSPSAARNATSAGRLLHRGFPASVIWLLSGSVVPQEVIGHGLEFHNDFGMRARVSLLKWILFASLVTAILFAPVCSWFFDLPPAAHHCVRRLDGDSSQLLPC